MTSFWQATLVQITHGHSCYGLMAAFGIHATVGGGCSNAGCTLTSFDDMGSLEVDLQQLDYLS